MAKAVGIIGAISGKMGDVVFGGTSEKGEVIMRAYNPNVHNPKTARQTFSRAKFTMGVDLFKTMTRALRAGWPKNGFQKAMAIAIPVDEQVITKVGSTLTWNYANVAKCISKNDLGNITSTAPDGDDAGVVKIGVTAPDSMFMDEGGNECGCGAVVVLFNTNTNETLVDSAVLAKGSETSISVNVPLAWSGLKAQVYVFAKQIPNAVNGIQAEDKPWMYPAKTSATFYAGQCDMQ